MDLSTSSPRLLQQSGLAASGAAAGVNNPESPRGILKRPDSARSSLVQNADNSSSPNVVVLTEREYEQYATSSPRPPSSGNRSGRGSAAAPARELQPPATTPLLQQKRQAGREGEKTENETENLQAGEQGEGTTSSRGNNNLDYLSAQFAQQAVDDAVTAPSTTNFVDQENALSSLTAEEIGIQIVAEESETTAKNLLDGRRAGAEDAGAGVLNGSPPPEEQKSQSQSKPSTMRNKKVDQFHKFGKQLGKTKAMDELMNDDGAAGTGKSSSRAVKSRLITAKDRNYFQSDMQEQKRERKFAVKMSPEILQMKSEDAELRSWLKFDLAFGFFVVANAVTMGIEANNPHVRSSDAAFLEDRQTTWWLNQLFLLIFMVELALRCVFDGVRQSFRKGWVQFDFTLIFIGVVDEWIVPNLNLNADLPFLAILRILRLLRLVRLVRLMDQFKELWLLVSSLINTLEAMCFLMILLIVVTYTASIFLVQTVGDLQVRKDDALLAGGSSSGSSGGATTSSGTTAASSTSSSTLLSSSAGTSGNSKDFSNIGRAMYTLLRIVTLDDWVSTIKGVTEPAVSWNSTALLELRELQGADVGEVIFMPGSQQVEEQQSDYNNYMNLRSLETTDEELYPGYPAMLVFFFLFTLVTSLGIMNLLVGRVVQTIHEASDKQEHVTHFEKLAALSDSLAYVRTWLQANAMKEDIHHILKTDAGYNAYKAGEASVAPSFVTAAKKKRLVARQKISGSDADGAGARSLPSTSGGAKKDRPEGGGEEVNYDVTKALAMEGDHFLAEEGSRAATTNGAPAASTDGDAPTVGQLEGQQGAAASLQQAGEEDPATGGAAATTSDAVRIEVVEDENKNAGTTDDATAGAAKKPLTKMPTAALGFAGKLKRGLSASKVVAAVQPPGGAGAAGGVAGKMKQSLMRRSESMMTNFRGSEREKKKKEEDVEDDNIVTYVTLAILGRLYEDPTAKKLFDRCGLQFRNLIEVYSEMREARPGDNVILADDYFEALLASLEKVSAVKMVQINCSVGKISGHLDFVEKDLFESFNALRKCSYDIWRLMGPFQSMFKARAETKPGGARGGGNTGENQQDEAAIDLFSSPDNSPLRNKGGPEATSAVLVAAVEQPGGHDAAAAAGTSLHSARIGSGHSGSSSAGKKSGTGGKSPRSSAAADGPLELNTTVDRSASSHRFRSDPTAPSSVVAVKEPRRLRKVRQLQKPGETTGDKPNQEALSPSSQHHQSAQKQQAPIVAQTDGEIQRAKKEKQAEQDALVWDRFDIFYGFFVISNGIAIGLKADNVAKDADTMWTLIDSFFYAVFCLELLQRAVLLNQLENYSDDTLLFGLFPRMERSEIFRWLPDTLKNSKKFFRDPWVVFDTIILLLGALEYILRWMGESFDGRMASVFRVFRLLRLIRIIRLFNALRELWLLMEGMVQAVGTLFWATLMLAIMIYVGAIIVKESIPTNERGNWKGKWDSLFNAMYRMLQIITFDSDYDVADSTWFSLITEVSEGNLFVFIFLLAFVVLTALGLMNLIVGVMVTQSYTIVQTEKSRLRGEAVVAAKQAMLQAKSVFASNVVVEQKQKSRNMDEFARSIRVSMAQFRDVMRNDEQLRFALEKGGITHHRIKHIFQKLSNTASSIALEKQSVLLSDFIEACLRLTQALNPVDLVACKVNFRELSLELEKLQKSVTKFYAKSIDFGGMEIYGPINHGGDGYDDEYRLAKEEHPAYLDIAKSKVEKENDHMEAQIHGLKQLTQLYLNSDSKQCGEFEIEEFRRQKNILTVPDFGAFIQIT
ncbi:unnamed protein product [Amoebophrya sp. A120]|nr:unnamed protein product [Amoebophrya sp. A120]|eukprot:GSA120T00016228001.1